MKIITRLGYERDGWQMRLRDNYENNFNVFKAYADAYGLLKRLGFETFEEAWKENPIIQGSVYPDDFCKVVDGKPCYILFLPE